ncbi:WhiB family transcriptional regulator [Streptomyces sp. NPDC046371]|uniref:WhiB family transcriptional regulator n=1 Tax=Streptomyces sp. NPDC046371 TaxID=3154916 RepID=UPI0033E81417
MKTIHAKTIRNSSDWLDRASCRSVGRETFYDGSAEGRQAARLVCTRCHVLLECLADTQALEAAAEGRWGMAAGLTAPQRLALVWEERLHGARPDAAKARELTDWGWRKALRRHHGRGLTLGEITQAIGGTTPQHHVTTRLALWWLGLDGARVRPRAADDLTPKWQRVVNEHRGEIEGIRAAGGNRFDVSAYLGVSISCAELAIARVNKLTAGVLEVAA